MVLADKCENAEMNILIVHKRWAFVYYYCFFNISTVSWTNDVFKVYL